MGEEAIATFNTDTTTRGFTGHEQIDAVGLIHMNGRVYDTELGRFLSADPHIQALDNLQNFNRYSYVLNNPLSYTDPTGFFFSKLFKAIGKAFGKIFKAIGRAFKKLLRSPIFRAIIQIVGCSFGAPACALISGAITAAAGGSLTDVLKAAAFAFLQVKVWPAVGNFLGANGLGTSFIGKGLVHGVVGGALSVAQGGNFMEGFAANAIGAVVGLAAKGLDIVSHTAVVAAAGCASAVLTGGKCANGAITAEFANLYNNWRAYFARLRAQQRAMIYMRSLDRDVPGTNANSSICFADVRCSGYFASLVNEKFNEVMGQPFRRGVSLNSNLSPYGQHGYAIYRGVWDQNFTIVKLGMSNNTNLRGSNANNYYSMRGGMQATKWGLQSKVVFHLRRQHGARLMVRIWERANSIRLRRGGVHLQDRRYHQRP